MDLYLFGKYIGRARANSEGRIKQLSVRFEDGHAVRVEINAPTGRFRLGTTFKTADDEPISASVCIPPVSTWWSFEGKLPEIITKQLSALIATDGGIYANRDFSISAHDW